MKIENLEKALTIASKREELDRRKQSFTRMLRGGSLRVNVDCYELDVDRATAERLLKNEVDRIDGELMMLDAEIKKL